MRPAGTPLVCAAIVFAAAADAQQRPWMEEVPTAFTAGDRPSHVRFTVTNHGATPLRVSRFELRYRGVVMPELEVSVESTGARATAALAPGQRVTLIGFFNAASLPSQWSYDFTLTANLNGRRASLALRVRRMIRLPLRR